MIPGWFLHGDLPPTGNRVVFTKCDVVAADKPTPLQISGYQSCLVQSGTAALALALIIARSRRPQIKSPSVILPAYGCPDLVAAAEFAGVRPVLVDIGADDPGYNLDQLGQALDKTTVAVVAVNFLGIRERLADIRALLASHPDALLIEDNAQWFPESMPSPANEPLLSGDLVCLSFGRGKPVSLLGGGALLIRSGLECDALASIDAAIPEGASLRLKAQLFNLLLHRHCYWLVNRNPVIELGQTIFKPLAQIRAPDNLRVQSLPAAIDNYLKLSRTIEAAWSRAFANLPSVKNISVAADRCGRLLRYPLLCRDNDERDRLRHELDCAGLGVTAMYQRPLPEIAGVDGKVLVFDGYSGAREFSAKLLTLPVHAGVTRKDVERVAEIIASCSAKR